uniref:Peroxisomal leader peptide-processing protease n=1 Tax=Cairina moschata TaxID=8855 RepID=A0A8C3CEA9_CAIMO
MVAGGGAAHHAGSSSSSSSSRPWRASPVLHRLRRAAAMSAELPCCVVSVGDGAEPCSCSGVILCRGPGLVLCHAAVFSPFLQPGPEAWSRHQALPASVLPPGLRVRLLHAAPQLGATPALQEHEAQPLGFARCEAFARALAGLAANWCGNGEPEGELEQEAAAALPWFAWLRAPSLDVPGGGWTPWASAGDLRKGAALLACGSPFGALCPDLFLNTLSGGVLSNAAGEGNALLLTDARCLPGTQGGAVLLGPAASRPRVVAVIAAASCGAGGRGLALLCSLHAVLRSSRGLLRQLGEPPAPPAPLAAVPGAAALCCVALVESGGAWGSGTLLAPRLLLTCRHVLQAGATPRVTLWPHGGGRATVLQARVLFATAEASPFDVAVLELQERAPGFQPPRLASAFQPGEAVLALGFGALGRACGPSVTGGVLSAVVGAPPVMLQSTCAVHPGSSGGPLLAASDGRLLGIVASNARDNAAGATYPHLNFCVPATLLQPPLACYLRTRDPAAFAPLDAGDEGARAAWSKQQQHPSKL